MILWFSPQIIKYTFQKNAPVIYATNIRYHLCNWQEGYSIKKTHVVPVLMEILKV